MWRASLKTNTKRCMISRKCGPISHKGRKIPFGLAPVKNKGELKDSPKDKVEILNAQFISVFSDVKPFDEDPKGIGNGSGSFPVTDQIHISMEGIQQLLENLSPNKPMGPDALHPCVLKTLAKSITPIFQAIFTTTLQAGPDD